MDAGQNSGGTKFMMLRKTLHLSLQRGFGFREGCRIERDVKCDIQQRNFPCCSSINEWQRLKWPITTLGMTIVKYTPRVSRALASKRI